MSSLKRPIDCRDSHDIRAFFKRARMKTALRRSGPFFLERILFPRLVHVNYRLGAALPDLTRLFCGDLSLETLRLCGALSLPHRIEASACIRRYGQLQHSGLRTVVSSGFDTSPFSVVTDIVFDMQDEFSVVCQPKLLTTYSTEKWIEGRVINEGVLNNNLPLVKVEARGSQRLGFGFSSVQFLSSSLKIVVGYKQASFVDIFDLEEVDEQTCEPQQRFSLTDSNISEVMRSDTSTAEGVYANDIVAVTEDVSLAALSSGLSVWLDRRSGRPEICTGVFAREYNIGQQSSRTQIEGGPLTAVAFLCREDPINVVCGTKAGAVQLWDVRCSREYIALHKTGATICRLQPQYGSLLRGFVWLNTLAGELQGVNVGHSDMRLIAAARCADIERSTETFHMPLPQLALMDPPGLIACPHVSSNSLLFYNTNVLRKKSLSTAERSDRFDNDCDVFQGAELDGDNDDSGGACSYKDKSHVLCHQNMLTASSKVGNIGNPSVSVGGDYDCNDDINGSVETIPVVNALDYKGFCNVTACAVWSKFGRFVMGDASGNVQLS